MVEHLEKDLCPKGARVWPVQSTGFLTASIDCGMQGRVYVNNSKTDYLFLTEEAWRDWTAKTGSGEVLQGIDCAFRLPHVIAFYEAKTTKSLKSNKQGPIRQGILELLAGDAMRGCPGKCRI